MSVQTSSALPAWRVAVIGVVAALAVGIGVALGSFLLAARVPAMGSGAAYVPADAPFYFEMRLQPSDEQDLALRDLLGHLPDIEGVDLGQPLYDQMTARIDEMLTKQGADVSWADDVATWFDGRVAIAVTDLSIAAIEDPEGMGAEGVPPVVVLLGVTDPTAADAAIDRMLAASGSPDTTDQLHAGETVHEVGTTGAYALTDDQLVVGSTADAVFAALDAHATGSGTLADVAEMTRLTSTLPDDWLAVMTYDMTDLMAESLAAAEQADPEMTNAMRALMEGQPLRGAMAVSASGDRVILDAATDAPSGEFAVENADRGLADEVPADALYYSEAGNIGTSLAAVIEPLKAAGLQMPGVGDQIDVAEGALGASIEELVTWIDDGAMVVGYDGAAPYGGMLLVPNDMDAAARRLGQLATFASLAATDPSSGIMVDSEEVGGITVTTIHWSGGNDAGLDGSPLPSSLAIEYAVTADRAVIGVGDTFVRRVLDLDAADSLGAQPRFTDAVAELGGSENAGMAWLDLAGTREAFEAAFGPQMAEGDEMATFESEILPWLLPLDRFVSVSRLDGDVVIQRAVLLVD